MIHVCMLCQRKKTLRLKLLSFSADITEASILYFVLSFSLSDTECFLALVPTNEKYAD